MCVHVNDWQCTTFAADTSATAGNIPIQKRNADAAAVDIMHIQWKPLSMRDPQLGLPRMRFEPLKDYVGSFQLEVRAWSGNPIKYLKEGVTKDLSERSIIFTFEVSFIRHV